MVSEEITVVQFVTFLLISTRMTMPMFILGMLLNQLQRGEAASKRVFALIDLEPSIFDKPDAIPLAGPIRSISFDDVSFAYPTSEANVLNGISFSASSGEFLGVMGHTGAGKSTILKLIVRFYEPQQVTVKINGVVSTKLTNDKGRTEGHIGLQLHGGQVMHVEYKDIKLRTLK